METIIGRKLTFDEVLKRLADERIVDASNVQASALKRKVWIAEWHIPGCMSESRQICMTKAEAVQAGLDFTGEDKPPHGMRAGLERDGFFQHRTELHGHVNTTIRQVTLAELL